ncbi:Ger(x)C family spore germination protein [Paenibacillus polysaccharolyticus]|uniref:Ger(x)C family spore germination protein n=1 Tax=Paenibacillus polysaccharolyticus TaxID=582692 RepID=UPI00209E0AAB|nr:Ger(x)C family spore germination protein [Paenibacillus polysaccharolyticus]MCP1136246.1 Ger(x)C family spore germination protein [Paenibacillus polysaccharolyticus]
MIYLLVLSLFLTTGCWDRREINDLAIVMAAGFDQGEQDSVRMTVQIFLPKTASSGTGQMSKGPGGSGETISLSSEGVTAASSLSGLRSRLSRHIFWGHNDVILLGDELAKEGIEDVIDFTMRNSEMRERTDVFVVDGQVEEALNINPSLERSSAETLRELTNMHAGINTNVKELVEMLKGDSGAAVLPTLKVSSNGESTPNEQLGLNITGTAILKKDKLVGWVNPYKTRGILWVRNTFHPDVINIEPVRNEGAFTIQVIQGETKLKPQIRGEDWSMDIFIHLKAKVLESTLLTQPRYKKYAKELEEEINTYVEQCVQDTLHHMQTKLKADVFDFAQAFHMKYPKEWEKNQNQWDIVLPKIQVHVHVSAGIVSEGKLSNMNTELK